MTSPYSELAKISSELSNISMKIEQLLEKKKMLCIYLELRIRAELGQTDEVRAKQQEIDNIENVLLGLNERKADLQKRHESILKATNKSVKKGESNKPTTSSQKPDPVLPETNIFTVGSPPPFPAPTVVLDMEKLPTTPCRTQCPECKQYILTETVSTVSSVTWLVCFMTALVGCVAGCCLIPFCWDRFKSIIHRCPKCRTSLTTIKKL